MSERSSLGACLCGAITFGISPPYRWFAYCHCSLCRKQHGSLLYPAIGVARDKLEWRSGVDDIVHYRATAAFERPFCRHCGSSVPAVAHDARFWDVPAGLLEGDPGARPRSQIFVGSKSPLLTLDDSLPRHETYPPGIDAPTVETRRTPNGNEIAGSCVCGGVTFAVAATPQRVVPIPGVPRVVNCYCSLCRRRTGSAFASTMLAPASMFRWLRGEARTRRYSMPQPRQYSTDFCADCGGAVPSVFAGQLQVMLPAGSIDSALPPLPSVHLYVGSKAPWYTIADGWPQFDELPPTLGSPRRGASEQFKEFFR
jgi:hypothetical protein